MVSFVTAPPGQSPGEAEDKVPADNVVKALLSTTSTQMQRRTKWMDAPSSPGGADGWTRISAGADVETVNKSFHGFLEICCTRLIPKKTF